ncbi:MAG: helix-turn-helix transcriptional regulator [Caldilineaceae bacterium]|nr:helix-turn-helix transcriptional regulator [Caldilineaceae bacterium]
MPNFGELLTLYIERAGITDAELARATGVQRQTIFRWKEGHTARPRYREDVLRIAAKLRLTPPSATNCCLPPASRRSRAAPSSYRLRP